MYYIDSCVKNTYVNWCLYYILYILAQAFAEVNNNVRIIDYLDVKNGHIAIE